MIFIVLTVSLIGLSACKKGDDFEVIKDPHPYLDTEFVVNVKDQELILPDVQIREVRLHKDGKLEILFNTDLEEVSYMYSVIFVFYDSFKWRTVHPGLFET